MGLSTLVVHLKSNYSHLQQGLKTSGSMVQSYGTATTSTLVRTAASARQLSTDLQGVTDRGSLQKVATSAKRLRSDVSKLSTEISVAERKLQTLAVVTSALGKRFSLLGKVLATVSAGVSILAKGLGVVGGALTTMLVAVSAAMKVLRVVGIVVSGAMIAVTAAINAVKTALWLLFTPVRLLWKGMVALAKAVWAVIGPFARLTVAVIGVWLQIKATILAVKWIIRLFGALPLKLKVVVGLLFALGAAARVSSTAVTLLAGASRLAATGVKLLLLPILAIRHPLAAAAMALGMLRSAMHRTIASAAAAARGVKRLAVAIGRGLVVAAKRATVGLQGLNRLVGNILTTLAKGLVAGAAAGLLWGVKLAAGAETAQTSFTTMLGSATAAKQVLSDLQQFSASTPFQLESLRDASKLLLNAQVPTDQLIARMTMLGDIAAGTGKPIGDFAKIYAKVKATGKVSLETLNQLAERGVPIYQTLAQAMGVSRSEMLSMISKGKVGFTDLHAALASTTAAGGIFAGGMAAQSQTLSGLWSTMKDNVGFALMEISQQLMTAFNFKQIMADGIVFVQRIKAGIISLTPIIRQYARSVAAQFGMIWEIATSVWNSIAGVAGVSAGDIAELLMTALAMVEFAFQNWRQIGTLAIMGVQLGFVRFGAAVAYLFTQQIPGVMMWLADNWKSVFSTMFDFTTTVFINLGKNIRSAMTAIWDFIKSGGTADLKLTWTPLTEGFRNTLSSLPDIPPRVMGPLEKALSKEFDSLKKATGDGMTEHVAARLKELDEFRASLKAAGAERESVTAPNALSQEEQQKEDETKKTVEVKVAGALRQGSADAYSAIINAMNQRRADPQAEQKKANQIAQNQLTKQGEIVEAIKDNKPSVLTSLA